MALWAGAATGNRLLNSWATRWYCLLPDLPGHGENVGLSLTEPLTFDSVTEGLFSVAEGAWFGASAFG